MLFATRQTQWPNTVAKHSDSIHSNYIMNTEQTERYSRHINLDDIGASGQQKLLDSTALIVGLGGLGSPCLLYTSDAADE